MKMACLPVLALGLMFCMVCSSSAANPPRLPAVLGDGAVIQCDAPVVVWGWADAGASVSVAMGKEKRSVTAGSDGRWKVKFKPVKSGWTGELTATDGKATVKSTDLIAGEVWFCSGQSNMAMNVNGSQGAKETLAAADDAQFRLFQVPNKVSVTPFDDVNAKWQKASAASVGSFSAAGYYFGREIRKNLGVPVGLIHASWGGSSAEVWIDPATLSSDPELRPILDRWKEIVAKEPEAGMIEVPFSMEFSEMQLVPADGSAPVPLDGGKLPGKWDDPWFGDGSTAKMIQAGSARTFSGIMRMSGSASVWRSFGGWETAVDLGKFSAIRFRARGSGNLALKVRQTTVWDWAFHGAPVKVGSDWTEITIRFAGLTQPDWGSQKPFEPGKVAAIGIEVSSKYSPPSMPSSLYQGMVAPVVPAGIRGALWYQGEGNAWRAYQYRRLLPAMIGGWRKAWGQGDFAFLIVQLANWRAPSDSPEDSDWAELREAQAIVAAKPNNGMAVAIDIGDANNIHPTNKYEVGRRLSLVALRQVYGMRKLVASGPRYKGMKVRGREAVISFTEIGSGLAIRNGGELRGYGVAGEDRKFHKASARIEKDVVVVESAEVAKPVAVRYAWANNPVCNLVNKEDLPAGPFRTDDWPGITADNR